MAEQRDIEKENLEYIAEAAAKKFFEQFSKAKVEPTININSGSASVEEISKQLAKMIQESASAAAGGCYSKKPCNPPKTIKDLKITLLGHELKHVSKLDFEGCRVKLDFWYGGEKDNEGSFSVDVPGDWVTFDFKR